MTVLPRWKASYIIQHNGLRFVEVNFNCENDIEKAKEIAKDLLNIEAEKALPPTHKSYIYTNLTLWRKAYNFGHWVPVYCKPNVTDIYNAH